MKNEAKGIGRITPLTLRTTPDRLPFWGELVMLGRIYAKGRCPECGGKFARTENDLICPIHFTRPRKFYIQLRTNQENVYSDRNGYSFSSFEHANQTLNKIRVEIREGTFDITRYVSQAIRPLRFRNWSEAWLKRKKIEVEKGLRSPSYLKTLRVYPNKKPGRARASNS